MKKFLFNYIIPYLLFFLIYLWCATLRSRNLNQQEENHFKDLTGPYILTLWHGRIFYLFYYLRRHPDYFLLISPSEDGDLLARLATLMGYSVIRGSTYKKAVSAARSLIKVLRKNQRIIIIADGSRGPRCVAHSGSAAPASQAVRASHLRVRQILTSGKGDESLCNTGRQVRADFSAQRTSRVPIPDEPSSTACTVRSRYRSVTHRTEIPLWPESGSG